MAKSIKMGPSAPKLHEQLGVEKRRVVREQAILDIVTSANEAGGVSKEFVREKHHMVLGMLRDKGIIKLK